jgi:hypothetical protein
MGLKPARFVMAMNCSRMGPLGSALQPERNTRFDFHLSGFRRLDKNPNWQHPASHKTHRFDWGWS